VIQITENIWIGDSHDEEHADLSASGICAVLNVAQDMQPTRGWDSGVDYMQVGLVDGPGNPQSAYYSAILALSALVERRRRVLVACHTGERSMAVAVMYLNTISGRPWDDWFRLLEERIDELPVPNRYAHREAFERINWPLLVKII